ncbi:MAG TPA: hypothetical protein VN923_16885 [Thermoanaerobaculia bacterium]|nr:hypothetical protein [Thermoanaerobaculia bacterium]
MTRGSFTWLYGAAAAAAGLIIASCIVQQEPAPGTLPANQGGPPGAEQGAPAGGLSNGEYSCSIEDSGYQYPPFRCVVYSGENGAQVLEKMGGSQRFRGSVQQDGDGFRFDGTFYCPQGDCTENVSGSFARAGDGAYRGTLAFASARQTPVTVSLQLTPGGMGYGGGTYGGATYAAPPPPAPR